MATAANPTNDAKLNGREKADLNEHKADISKDLDALRADLKSLAQTVSDIASNKTSAASSAAQDRFDEYRKAGERQADRAKEYTSLKAMEAEEMIRENPAGAVAVSAAIGFAIGLLTRRR